MTDPGQILVELTVPELDEDYRQKHALVGQAQAAIKQAVAAVKVAEAAQASAEAKIDEAEAGVARVLAQIELYTSELSRMKELAKRGGVKDALVDEKQSLLDTALASRKEVAAKVRSAEAARSEAAAQLEKAQADQEAAKERLNVARADEQRVAALVEYKKIRAPFDGIVSERNVNIGHLIQAATGDSGKYLLRVVQSKVVRIFVDVPETDAVLTKPGNPATIRIPSLSAQAFQGAVTRTSWTLTSGTRTLKTEIDVKNDDGILRPGMYASAEIEVARRVDALALPKTALLAGDGQMYCLTIDSQGQIAKTPIVAGIRAGDDVEIVSGLSGDERVIGVNPAAFREGQRVEVK
jgi:RND family efflux transporter MFP subunit